VRRVALALFLTSLILSSGCGLFGRGGSRPAAFTGPLDVNTASLADIEQLPGVTPSMARRIFEGRPYATVDELVERGLLSERELDRVRKKIKVRPAPPPAASP
jgi:competence protein ComEA